MKKLKSGASSPKLVSRSRNFAAEPDTIEISGKLEQYLEVAKGEINRLDYIITQFLQAIDRLPPQLKPDSLNDVVEKTLGLLRPELEKSRINGDNQAGAAAGGGPPLDATQMQTGAR